MREYQKVQYTACHAHLQTDKSLWHRKICKYLGTTPELSLRCPMVVFRALQREMIDPNDLDKLDRKGNSHLHTAVKGRNIRAVNLLVFHGASPNYRDKHGKTSLHLAIQSGSEEIACLLIKAGADLNCKDGKGKTPLHYAVSRNTVWRGKTKEMTHLLLEAGADPECRDNKRKLPTAYAEKSDKSDETILLVKKSISERKPTKKEDKSVCTQSHFPKKHEDTDSNDTEEVVAVSSSIGNMQTDKQKPVSDHSSPEFPALKAEKYAPSTMSESDSEEVEGTYPEEFQPIGDNKLSETPLGKDNSDTENKEMHPEEQSAPAKRKKNKMGKNKFTPYRFQ